MNHKNLNNPIISGRKNLAVTVYAPFDCKNNCAFCTSKELYKRVEPNPEKVSNILKKLTNIKSVKDVVFTGGEPLADLQILSKLVKNASSKNIFINTTFSIPNDSISLWKFREFWNENKNYIKGFNISRHLFTKTNGNDKLLMELEKEESFPYRINSVLLDVDILYKDLIVNHDNEKRKFFKENVDKLLSKYTGASTICFRRNYVGMTVSDLKSMDDPFFEIIDDLFDYNYYGGGGCQVCQTDNFTIKTGDFIADLLYHRGLEYSSYNVGKTLVVNDIIVYPDGSVYYDWDESTKIDDLDQFCKMLDSSYECQEESESESETKTKPKSTDETETNDHDETNSDDDEEKELDELLKSMGKSAVRVLKLDDNFLNSLSKSKLQKILRNIETDDYECGSSFNHYCGGGSCYGGICGH